MGWMVLRRPLSSTDGRLYQRGEVIPAGKLSRPDRFLRMGWVRRIGDEQANVTDAAKPEPNPEETGKEKKEPPKRKRGRPPKIQK